MFISTMTNSINCVQMQILPKLMMFISKWTITQLHANARMCSTITQSRGCDFFTLTCSWHMISQSSPYMSCGLSPSREVTVLRKKQCPAADISFIICNAKKMSPISLFMTSIYKSTGCSLYRSSQFPSETDSAGSVPGPDAQGGFVWVH